jgi:hypothetical protein
MSRSGRYASLLVVVIAVLAVINLALTKPGGGVGIEPGHVVPPFAAPLANGGVTGDVNVASAPDQGSAGSRPACSVRGQGILNVCALYEHRPLVLALFVDAGSCPAVLDEMQSLAGTFAGVALAAVAIKGEPGQLQELIRTHGLRSVSIGFDSDGVLAGLYKVASCPQVSLILPGGVMQSPALLSTPSLSTLRTRVLELEIAARARGWSAPVA